MIQYPQNQELVRKISGHGDAYSNANSAFNPPPPPPIVQPPINYQASNFAMQYATVVELVKAQANQIEYLVNRLQAVSKLCQCNMNWIPSNDYACSACKENPKDVS